MPHYAIKIYQRRRQGETRGTLHETIEFDAPNVEAAEQVAYAKIDGIDWERRFAALWSDDEHFLVFWGAAPHA
jgi:hypothetical protein